MSLGKVIDDAARNPVAVKIRGGCPVAKTEIIPLLLNNLVAKAVERGDGNGMSRWPDILEQTVAHRHRTGISIGQTEDTARIRLGGGQDINNPGGKNLGFSGPGTGNNQNRPLKGVNGQTLFKIQTVEQRCGVEIGHTASLS